MAMNPFDGQTISLAFPSITLGALPAASEASAVDDPEERARLAAEQARASVVSGAKLSYDDVIDPRELRNALLAGLSMTEGRDGAQRRQQSFGILP
jgi:acetyl-CoA carboxylase carboxyltransferase component